MSSKEETQLKYKAPKSKGDSLSLEKAILGTQDLGFD